MTREVEIRITGSAVMRAALEDARRRRPFWVNFYRLDNSGAYQIGLTKFVSSAAAMCGAGSNRALCVKVMPK